MCIRDSYNTLPALKGQSRWYWRVGYDLGTNHARWIPAYSFEIAADSVVWDRSRLANLNFEARDHPRILLRPQDLDKMRRLADTNQDCRELLDRMRKAADKTLLSEWWRSFPETDTRPAQTHFLQIAHELTIVGFLRALTGEPKYDGVKARAVKLASFPKGGLSSPEGAGGDGEDATQSNELLALLFDWLYPELNEEQRSVMIRSLEWRVNHIMNEFAWKYQGLVQVASIGTQAASHQYEAAMDTVAAGLVLLGHSQIGREWSELMLHHLIGITNNFGLDEGWNEGAGYGLSKMKWLLNATIYADTALDAELGKNPYYQQIGEYFSRLVPLGLAYSPWGNNSANPTHLQIKTIANFRRLALLTGDGRFLRRWRESGGPSSEAWIFRPWIDYVLPFYYRHMAESSEWEPLAVYPAAGYVMAATKAPNDLEAFKESVGIIFQARPAGGYSHSFHSDGSFQLYAYGEQLNHGGGSTANEDAFAYHTISHHTLLIDGLGQVQPSIGQLEPQYSRLAALGHGPGYVYFAADVTRAYPSRPGKYQRWGFPVHAIYAERHLSYLKRFVRNVLFVRGKYFVIFDEVESDRPATYTWLYHILPDSMRFDPAGFTVQYNVGAVRVKLAHAAQPGGLVLDDRKGTDALVNPITGEDCRRYQKKGPLPAHSLWISNRDQAKSRRFLAVVFPYREGGPGASDRESG